MALAVKGVLTIVGSGIGCCSIGLPVFVSSGGNLQELFHASSSTSGNIKQISLEECQTQESSQTIIEYGDKNNTNVCWKVDWQNQELSNKENIKSRYTQLFKEMWNYKTDNWNVKNSAKWKSQCLTIPNKWVMTNMSDGKEYLGWCYESQSESQLDSEKIFIKKDITSSAQEGDSENKVVKLYICVGECFQEKSQSDSTDIKQLETETGTWKEVTFKNK